MNYALLADGMAVVHFATIVAVLGGLLVCFRYKRFRPWEAGLLIGIVVLWSYYGNCPFTIVEQNFRDLAGQEANLTSVGFLPYYVNKLFNFTLDSRTVQRFTFFTGGAFFAASIEWFAPFFHMEVSKLRHFLGFARRKRHLTKVKRV